MYTSYHDFYVNEEVDIFLKILEFFWEFFEIKIIKNLFLSNKENK